MKLFATSAVALFGASVLSTSAPIVINPQLTESAKTSSISAKSSVADKPAPAPVPAAPTPVIVVVQPGDNLTALATSNGTTALRIFYANTSISNPDLIFPAQQLRIPTADETLATRPVPVNTQIATPSAPAASQAAEAQPETSASSGTMVSSAGEGVWDQIAACESGGNWSINTGNGFYGGLQFTLSSWHAVGGSGYPNEASKSEQIARAQTLQAHSGWGAWPACSAKLGL